MKKIFLIALAVTMLGGIVAAQEPDLAAIAQARKVKTDSLSLMLGKVYGAQAAMTHTTAEARKTILETFKSELNLDQQDEQYREGVSIAEQFYRNAEGINNRMGINMSRKIFAQTFLTRLNDTTSVKPINEEVRDINLEAKRLMEEIGELKKDSVAAINKAGLIDIKADSLSRNMGNFFGAQVQNLNKNKNLSEAQIARFIDGFNSTINIDESNKPLIDGKLLASDYKNFEQRINKQMSLNLNKDLFTAGVAELLNDPNVPTDENFKAIDSQAQNYLREVQTFAQENSPEALTQKGLGKKYIENQMEKDPKFIQSPSGMVYKILNPGNGKKFTENDKIKVMYKGTHVDGTTFDESKEPVSFAPKQVVPGFKEALLMMSPGAKMIAILPYNLAYGARGAGGNIKPFETLIFEIETLGIDDSTPAANPDDKTAKTATTTTKAKEAKATSTQKANKTTGKKTSSKKTTGKKSSKKRK